MSKLVRVTEGIKPINGNGDSLFIACASYEERTIGAVRNLSGLYSVQRCLICRSIEYKEKGQSPVLFDEMTKRLSGCSGAQPREILFTLDDPIGFIRQIDHELVEHGASNSLVAVTVDITTFPRQELMILLRYLDSHPARGRIRLVYVEPTKYATESGREEARWLTRGVRSVHAVPGFCGIQYPQLSKLLIVILGHEGERTHITVRRHQPDQLVLLPQGEEQYHGGLSEIAGRENKNMISQFGAESLWESRLPARGVVETVEAIGNIFERYKHTHNVFIAPNGTKLQLIGTYLVARKLVELQVTYATPVVYNWQRYSTGIGPVWEMTLNRLGGMGDGRGA